MPESRQALEIRNDLGVNQGVIQCEIRDVKDPEV